MYVKPLDAMGSSQLHADKVGSFFRSHHGDLFIIWWLYNIIICEICADLMVSITA